MDVVMKAWNLVADKGLDRYVDQAYQELLTMYQKVGANTENIRASEIEARCYKLAEDDNQKGERDE